MASATNETVANPKVTVALDFGTTFSGFAYAHTADPARIHSFYDYPKVGREKPYVKTLTASYYKLRPGTEREWQLKSWGYPARVDFERDVQALRKHLKNGSPSDALPPPTLGHYLTKFKLHLAGANMQAMSSASALPEGLTKKVVIADYLREMGGLVLSHLQRKFGAHLTMAVVQWCITVPSIWNDFAKATMKSCMAAAGLVQGADGSPHPLIVVLEPEAAAFHCHKAMAERILGVGGKLLVADIGGGTSDIVVQEVVRVGEGSSSHRVKEVTTSTGALVGGMSVDHGFNEFLYSKVGPCLLECVLNHRYVSTQLFTAWERAKTSFGEPTTAEESTEIEFPNVLASEWESYDRRRGIPARDSYDGVDITYQEQQAIFDPVVDEILNLISHQLDNIKAPVKVLVVVGGFAESPYLLDRIRRRFASVVPHIFSPPSPGSAVPCGAVALAANPGMIVSRICKRTYGFVVRSAFEQGVDPVEYMVTRRGDGHARCRHRFMVLVRKGDEVRVDECVSRKYNVFRDSRRTKVRLFSSDDADPRYTKGENVKKEGKFYVWDVSAQNGQPGRSRPELKVSLFFGRSCIEIKAEGVNFLANQQVGCPVPVDYLY